MDTFAINDLTEYSDHTEFALSPSAPEAHVTLDIPPQLVWECAAGLEDPTLIAQRFGFEGEKWERLSQWPPFITAVQAQRSDFERNGMTFRLKAGLMAEEMMSMMFKQAISNDSTILQKLSVFNALTDVAGLKAPKLDAGALNAAPKFSITINIPQGAQPLTIDG
jgi:hypothetical protein